jgi:hypothetical protein
MRSRVRDTHPSPVDHSTAWSLSDRDIAAKRRLSEAALVRAMPSSS